ncbi:MAG: Shikimate dehydrogenase [Candidatus Heimdallarchaeota archaeon LC_2]|nr:MAG: Shikimate dehydrogenase [Candidatus Heimdallarchaeota archaeon LC_2]
MTVAIVLKNYENAIELLKKEQVKNRLFELRLDFDYKLLSLIENNQISPHQAILTIRSKSEGGKLDNDATRDKIINKALEMKVGYLDLELKSDYEVIKKIVEDINQLNSTNLIISQHNYIQSLLSGYSSFYTTFLNLNSLNTEINKRIILKYVGSPDDSYETLELMEMIPQHSKQILLGIGKRGDISRTLHSKLGQELVFGGLQDNDIIPYQVLDVLSQSNTLMLGLVGGNISHSLSPLIHNILMKTTKLSGYYHLLEANNSNRANNMVRKLINYDFTGFNITIPYKKSIIKILDQIDHVAENIQAVNTINIVNGKLFGFNTDITGFSRFLREHNLHKLEGALVLGAGGASRAICQSLIQEGVSVSIVTRSEKRFNEFPKDLRSQINLISKSDFSNKMRAELYINTTPLGLKGEDPRDFVELPINIQAVIDLLYHENENTFVQKIKNKGIEAYDGKEMLFNQAADSFQIWTNKMVKKKDLYNQFLKEIR